MKTKEELNALRIEVETLNKKLAELSEDELGQVTGGLDLNVGYENSDYDIFYKNFGVETKDLTKPGEYCAPISFR